MRLIFTILTLLMLASSVAAQPPNFRFIRVSVLSIGNDSLQGATVSLYRADSSLLKTEIVIAGVAEFKNLPAGIYFIRASHAGYNNGQSSAIDLEHHSSAEETIRLSPEDGLLANVTVVAKKPMIQFLPDKTVINVEAGITNAGATVMEVLERSPGITVDRNGNISMKGRPSVLVMIDGKMTQLSGPDLQNMLSGMSASQVDVIELIENPGAKYDAAGNAGIINIKTKKNKQKGFNGSATVAFGHGRLPKSNNSFIINSRSGQVNLFATYSNNLSRTLMDMYALRTYFRNDGSIASLLEQPYFTESKNRTHNLRAGLDYFAGKKTTLGLAFTGTSLDRDGNSRSTIDWKKQSGIIDSTISTFGLRHSKLEQRGINFNARHTFDASSELSADVDYIGYDISNYQYFENQLLAPGSVAEATQGNIPSELSIFTAKADYSKRRKNLLWEAGLKSARIDTDNAAAYYNRNGNQWEDDLGKSNHFLYTENIHAVYSSLDHKTGKWHWQAGLRYEYTGYQAKQLGNAVVKDSSFNRSYSSLFLSGFVTYEADSINSLTFRMGRRIDRPAFHKLNPFIFIINKYTLQKGNPFFRPQFTWNMELNHLFKQKLSTSITYSFTKDYFSQIFLADTTDGTAIYTEGNVGKMQNIGLSMSLQLSPATWWSLTAQAVYNHKIIEGFVWSPYKASINQVNMNLNNQFRFKKGWGAELSGFFISRNQNDLQEVLDPTGQVGLGVSKQLFQNKGTLRFTVRDIFYTQAMQGLTDFENSSEYFRVQWDTQVATLSFVYRFGKAMKQPKRSGGGAADEMNRVGTGN